MATRFYFPTSGAPVVSPAYDAAWEQTGGADRVVLVRQKLLTVQDVLANKQVTVPITTTQQILNRQFTSEPLPPQTITGTFSMVIRTYENATTNNAHLACIVRIVSQDGQTFRGTLFSSMTTISEFPLSGATATRIIAVTNVTSQTAKAGDRLVVEVGVHAQAPTAAGSANERFGNNAASDFALTTALTTDLNPWCEFSQNLWAEMPENFKSFYSVGLMVTEKIR